MSEQNYSNHRRYIPLYHFVTGFIVSVLFISSIYYSIKAAVNHVPMRSELFFLLISFVLVVIFWYARSFAERVQDRVIRLEENFRCYLLTGKTLENKLTIQQIIGLRFASDEEFIELSQKALNENMSKEEIKKAVKNWRADFNRC